MLTDLVFRLRALFARTRIEREIDEELRFHFDRQVEAYQNAGFDHAEALRRTRLQFGGLDQVKEEYRDALGVRLIDDLRRDVRLAIRSLKATPAVTAVAILSLALVIGANTAIFSILNGLLLRTLPVHEPTRLAHVTDSVVRETGETRVRAWGYPAWEQIRQRSHLFEAATAWSFTRFNLSSGGETQFVEGIWADGGFFETLGVPAVLGRTFSSLDDQRGGGPDGPVTVISHNYWQRHFGGAVDVIGRSVRLNSRMALGAAPEGVIALVLLRVSLLVGVGIVAGTGISIWASKFAGSLIYGLPPREPLTLVGAAVLLCVIGALAGWFPARTAARMDPVAVLRES